MNFKFQISNSERGVSLIITFFVMIIILTVVLSVSIILYSEVKVIRNVGNSVASFYAAESGIEKVLYYDRQVIPTGGTRGLCYMLNKCITGSSGETSIFCCNSSTITPLVCLSPIAPVGSGCGLTTCTNCSINFATVFDGRTYSVTASVDNIGNQPYYLDVASGGAFGGAGRKIKINIPIQP